MTTLGVTFPSADDSVKHAVQQTNSIIDLARKSACSPFADMPGGPIGLFHQLMLGEIERERRLAATTDLYIQQQLAENICNAKSSLIERMIEKQISTYWGPAIPFIEEWKTLFLSMESDAIGLGCSDNNMDPAKLFDNLERMVRSSYKSICGSKKTLIAQELENATGEIEQLVGAIAVTKDVIEQSGVNLDPVSCPSGFSVLKAHYLIMLAVLFSGFALAATGFLMTRRLYHSPSVVPPSVNAKAK